MSETGAQLFARLEGRRCLKDIEPQLFPEDCGPLQGDIVELHGTEGTAKTEMLYHLIVRCILPTKHGGLEAEVMFVDTDFHFDTLRLVTILEARLAQLAAGAASEKHPKEGTEEEEGDEETVKACLRRLFVVHCSSSAQMLLSFHYLEGWFSSRPALGLLVLDSISAFYWQDRSGGGESVPRQEANLRKCAQLLDRLRRDYGIVVFATVHAVMRNYGSSEASSSTAPRPCEAPSPSSSSSSSSNSRRWSTVVDFDKPYLCRAWQRLVTHRLVFSKSDILKGRRPVFSVACTTTRTRGVKRSSFCIADTGLQFL
ncbi:DNA repair protein XRCC2 isoform X2 [Alosa sapidissima]|uniref:DNA repair protein XRCC2 isoform X2 n=1 Tax=Alosa sapidissima TaxID=34773 RepID=UPI001C0977CC|nr:DNA repair protein XRCC2 isoform X2 [Alosa sapidissima]